MTIELRTDQVWVNAQGVERAITRVYTGLDYVCYESGGRHHSLTKISAFEHWVKTTRAEPKRVAKPWERKPLRKVSYKKS